IRGFRIELGEIEAALAAHPAVREATVLDVPGPGGKALAAYAVATGPALDPERILTDLGRTLPGYMVPAVLVELPELPLTHTGKVDRRALPEPVFAAAAGYQPPETDMEDFLAELWQEVLERDEVGVTDSFFDLGGHSLLAARILARLRDELEVDVPLPAFFESRTIRRLAVVVEDLLLATAGDTA
ncbi:MAG: peptide synthase, partial [Acidobacteria bacterium]|nr:peptide synthase [Acidobacteriota bacterium]